MTPRSRRTLVAIAVTLVAGSFAASPAVLADDKTKASGNSGTSSNSVLTDYMRSTGEYTLGEGTSGAPDPAYGDDVEGQAGQSSTSSNLYRDRDGCGTRRYGTATPSGGQ